MSTGAPRSRVATAASSAAASVEHLASSRRTYSGTAKDASHAAFYAGAAKGLVSAFNGLVLFFSRKELQQSLKTSLLSAANAHIFYAALALLVVILIRDDSHSWTDVFWALSRWSRLLTLIVSAFLEHRVKVSELMFVGALQLQNSALAAEVRAAPVVKRNFREKASKWKRIAKLMVLRGANAAATRFIPSVSIIVSPVVKYVAMRPTLGTPFALAIAAIHVLPESVLALGHLDDLLLSVSEAVIDAADFGEDALRPYLKRLTSEQVEYFRERYRGYITGMGTLYCMLEAIPFMGLPIELISECGAACLLEDVVARNLDKTDRMELCGEMALKTGAAGGAERDENSKTD